MNGIVVGVENNTPLMASDVQEGPDGGVLLRRGVSNLPLIDVLPAVGANVYDILRHDYVIITLPALESIIERLSRPVNRGFKPKNYDIKTWMAKQGEVKVAEAERALRFPAWLQSVKDLERPQKDSVDA